MFAVRYVGLIASLVWMHYLVVLVDCRELVGLFARVWVCLFAVVFGFASIDCVVGIASVFCSRNGFCYFGGTWWYVCLLVIGLRILLGVWVVGLI